MDKKISYNDALGAVDESVLSFDTSKLCSSLQRFPVLQVFAAQRLIRRLGALKKNEAIGLVVPITEVIGCIVTPRDPLAAECRMSAIYLLYSIQDQDESILRAILKRMTVAKRSCEGCGLFVHTVSTESLNKCSALATFIADHLSKDEARRYDTDTQYWTDVLDLLEREGFLKAGEQYLVPNLRSSSLRTSGTPRLRRLRLRTNVRKKWRKNQTHNARTSSGIMKWFECNNNEQFALLKLVTMHTACPDFVAEKLDARGLTSICASRIRALCDSVSSSQRQATSEDALGLKSFASIMTNPLHTWTHARRRNGLTNEVVPSTGEGTDLFAVYKLWMPLEVGTQSAIKGVLCGEVLMDTILDTWMRAKGNMRSSVDQILVAVLSHDETFQKLVTNHLCPRGTATPSGDPTSTVDTQIASPLRQVNKCLRCLEQTMIRGTRYPSAFWDQAVQVFHGLTDVVVLALLHDVQGASNQHVKEAITRSRSVEKRFQDHIIEHQRVQPRKDYAVVKVCDCSSVEMTWKHLRRSRFNAWRKCRCMIPNAMLVRVPKPTLCFSWARRMITGKNKTRSMAVDSDSSVSVFLWLYGNPAWGGVQYNHSEREILRCVIDIALQDESGVVLRDTGEILAHALRNTEARENMLSDIATSASSLMCDSKPMLEPRTLDGGLRLLRRSIEELWKSACQHLEFFKPRHESAELMSTSPAETRGIEGLLTMMAPCSSAIHDCIRDMPKLCRYIALTHRHLLANEGTSNEASMHIRLIVGLLSPIIDQHPSSKTERFPQRGSFSESVMRCFE